MTEQDALYVEFIIDFERCTIGYNNLVFNTKYLELNRQEMDTLIRSTSKIIDKLKKKTKNIYQIVNN